MNAINKRHLGTHSITKEQYLLKFPNAPLQSEESRLKRQAVAVEREATLDAESRAQRSSKLSVLRIGKPSWNKGLEYSLEWSDEARARVSARGAWNKGILSSDEQKAKQSEAMKHLFVEGLVHWNLGNITPETVRQKISEGCSGRPLTSDQRAKQIEGIRLFVSSPGYKNSMFGKDFTTDHRNRLSSAGLLAATKIRAKHEAAGRWVPLAQVPAVLRYKRKVRALTEKNVHLVQEYDSKKRGLNDRGKQNYQIDHRFSIVEGWLQEVPPEIIAHPANLRFVPWQENSKKRHQSELTLQELFKLAGAV